MFGNGFGTLGSLTEGAIRLDTDDADVVFNNLVTSDASGLNCLGCKATMDHHLV